MVPRIVAFLFAALLTGGNLRAHDVVWWEDPDGLAPGNAMDFYYPMEVFDFIGVVPSDKEPCTVTVNLDPPTSTLISAQVLEPNPANEVDILVRILRAPNGNSETATVSGEWHATGLPKDAGCTAVMPNKFSVPIVVLGRLPLWRVMVGTGKMIKIDAGLDCTLQAADSLVGRWINVGKGQSFTLGADMPTQFFKRFKRVGGIVSGKITDPSGSPLSGVTLGLPYGGPATIADGTGAFSFPRLPWGSNLIAISNEFGASLNMVIPAITNTAVGLVIGMAAVLKPPTNVCNCTPWCAIGFGSLPGGQTPVYYAGGANPPKVGPADCGQPEVTVTTPGGSTFPIVPGTSRHQNSGPDPASGTWTVTTTVCGQTKSCSVTVP